MGHGRVTSVGAIVATLGALAAFAVPVLAATPAAATTTASLLTTTTTTTTTSSTTTTTTTTAPKPKPKPKPRNAGAKLYLANAFFLGKDAVTVPGRWMKVGGVVTPYVPGQWVSVKVMLGDKVFHTDRLRIKPSKSGWYGKFTEGFNAPGAGLVTVQVIHHGNSKVAGFSASRREAVLNTNAGFGATGQFVQLIQQRLAALHFYIPQTGVYDNGTGLAIDAFHRLVRWGVYQTLDARTINWLLNGWGSFKVRFPSHGMHAEGNLTLQVLALINGSKVEQLYPISSGKPSTPTILGDFHVYSRVPGYLSDGMYFSDFFIGGYAIHGYNPAPDYPASHGCMRLPIPDAISAFNWLNYGDWVDVYY
jgi:hypothetical protein